MSECGFTLAHYREALRALVDVAPIRRYSELRATGPQAVIRHDIDLDLLAVPPMLAIEVELGVSATYFFRLTAETYNLLGETGIETLRRVREGGGTVGLHFDAAFHGLLPGDALDAAIEEEAVLLGRLAGCAVDLVSFHRPQPGLLGWRPRRIISAYDSDLMMPRSRYISDSAMQWREGCLHQHLDPAGWGARRTLQVLVHPAWWAERPGDVASRIDEFHRRSEARFDETVRREVRTYASRGTS